MRILLSLGHPVATDLVRYVAKAESLLPQYSSSSLSLINAKHSQFTYVRDDFVCAWLHPSVHSMSSMQPNLNQSNSQNHNQYESRTLSLFQLKLQEALSSLPQTSIICFVFVHPLQPDNYLRVIDEKKSTSKQQTEQLLNSYSKSEFSTRTDSFKPLWDQGAQIVSLLEKPSFPCVLLGSNGERTGYKTKQRFKYSSTSSTNGNSKDDSQQSIAGCGSTRNSDSASAHHSGWLLSNANQGASSVHLSTIFPAYLQMLRKNFYSNSNMSKSQLHRPGPLSLGNLDAGMHSHTEDLQSIGLSKQLIQKIEPNSKNLRGLTPWKRDRSKASVKNLLGEWS